VTRSRRTAVTAYERRTQIDRTSPAVQLVWRAPEKPVSPRTARLDFLVTCPDCGTTRLVTSEQIRVGTWRQCPSCSGGSEAA
jgi:predicted RNA-binding Zn-ribbon protein involved in translation (DUF1610 family)